MLLFPGQDRDLAVHDVYEINILKVKFGNDWNKTMLDNSFVKVKVKLIF